MVTVKSGLLPFSRSPVCPWHAAAAELTFGRRRLAKSHRRTGEGEFSCRGHPVVRADGAGRPMVYREIRRLLPFSRSPVCPWHAAGVELTFGRRRLAKSHRRTGEGEFSCRGHPVVRADGAGAVDGLP